MANTGSSSSSSSSNSKATSESYKNIDKKNPLEVQDKNLQESSLSLDSTDKKEIPKTKKEQAKSELDDLLELSKKEINKETETKQTGNHKYNNTVTEIKYGNDKEELDKKFRERYVKDQNNNYRWAFNHDIVAFQDTGKVILVKGKPASVSEDVAKLLKSQGVTEIKVSGEKEHKQRIWMAATERGIEVKGYKPSKEELKEMESMVNKITVLKQETDPKKNEKRDILESHRVAATKVAEKNLHPENKALFIKQALNQVNKTLNRGEKVQKVVVKESEKELEK